MREPEVPTSPYQRADAGPLGYQGPPPMTPPPAGWRPQYLVAVPPPRQLPAQDHAAIDAEEARARTFTRGLAAVVGAILLVLLCALSGRVLF